MASVGFMRRAVGAVLYHCSDIDDTAGHYSCPKAERGWCKWQQDKIKGTSKHRDNKNLPTCTKRLLQPISCDIGKDVFLKKCFVIKARRPMRHSIFNYGKNALSLC